MKEVSAAVHGLSAALRLRLSRQPVGSNCQESFPCHDLSHGGFRNFKEVIQKRDTKTPHIIFHHIAFLHSTNYMHPKKLCFLAYSIELLSNTPSYICDLPIIIRGKRTSRGGIARTAEVVVASHWHWKWCGGLLWHHRWSMSSLSLPSRGRRELGMSHLGYCCWVLMMNFFQLWFCSSYNMVDIDKYEHKKV